MIRISKPIGFIIGTLLGIYTRDNYLDIQQDYEKINKSIDDRTGELERTIARMEEQLQLAQGVYIAKKMRKQEGQDPNTYEQIHKKQVQ